MSYWEETPMKTQTTGVITYHPVREAGGMGVRDLLGFMVFVLGQQEE